MRPTEVTSSGAVAPRAPGVQDLGGALPQEEQHPRVDLGEREQLDLQRGDQPEVAAAAAQGPEQVRVVLVIDTAQPAVRGHELDGDDAVGREAVPAAVPADAAAEHVWELMRSLAAFRDPATAGLHVPWLRALSGRLGGIALEPAVALIPPRGYAPDFLTPPPAGL